MTRAVAIIRGPAGVAPGAAAAEALARLMAEAGPGVGRPWSAAEIRSLAAAPGARLLTAADGFALIRSAAGEAELLMLAVRPDARRRGLGRALLEAAQEAAAADGADRLILEVAEDNAPARALYAAQGYAGIGRRPRYYRRPGAQPVDALILARALGSSIRTCGARGG